MVTATATSPDESTSTGLHRTVGFWGLTFVSLGSIIGSGWLLGALTAATIAGGASVVSWVLAAVMLGVLAIIHADLGAAYPVAGGTSRYPHYAFGGLAGFTAGWTTYIQSVAIAPLEVEASIGYVNTLPWVHDNFDMETTSGSLTGKGLIIGLLAIILFTYINLLGAKFMSDSNTGIVLWKIFVPVLTIVVLMIVVFHPGNFTAGGGFMPFGVHGIFAALPAGVVFALQGFEQAAQMAGEAKDPAKHLAKAILTAMAIGALIYLFLEVAFIGALNPADIGSWKHPIGEGNYGPYYTLSIGAGVTWLAVVLIVDAVISPGGTGLIYVGTSSRISYALGLPDAMRRTNKRGVPVLSVVVAALIGMIFLAPTPSWQQLVTIITGSTAIMYGFAPPALAALRKADPDRTHPYRMPLPSVLLPLGFIFASLIIYWGQFDTTWKLCAVTLLGQVIYLIASAAHARSAERRLARWRSAVWIWGWLLGLAVIGYLGQYGGDTLKVLPDGIDDLVVALWSLIVFYYAVSTVMPPEDVRALVVQDQEDEDMSLEPATA